MSGPAYHARTHLPGGTDPIQSGSAGAFTTYRDCVLGDPTLTNFWPCDDAGGGIVDVVTSGVMTEIASGGWPHYGEPGPFAALPAQTAVANGGVAGAARFSANVSLPGGATPFTLQGWLYQVDVAIGGTVWEDWAGGAGAAKNFGITNSPFAVSYSHGSGLTVTGGNLIVGQWVHVRVDYDGTTLRLFVDGVLVATDTGAGSGVQSNNHFLNNNNTGGSGFAPFQGRAALWSLHDNVAGFCSTGGEGGGGDAPEFFGGWADGVGGLSWHLAKEENIEDSAVTTDKIDALAVSSAKLAANSVVAGKIAAGTIVNADVSATADIVVTKLAEGTDGQTLKTVGTTPTWVTVPTPSPADDTYVWMPLTTVVAGDPVLVWDGTDSLIPTLTPI